MSQKLAEQGGELLRNWEDRNLVAFGMMARPQREMAAIS